MGVATLTGSILTRNRTPVLRFLLPPAFFLISLNQFLPKTSANLGSYGRELEERYVPALAEKQDVVVHESRKTWELLKFYTQDSREKVSRGVVGAVGSVQELTGLKLQDAFGWSDQRAKVLENRVEEVKAVVEKHVEEAKVVVEQGIEDAKDVVEEKVEDIKRLV